MAPHVGAAVHAACVQEALHAPASSDFGFLVLDAAGAIAHAAGAGLRLLSTAGDHGSSIGLRVFLGLVRRALRDPRQALPAPLVLSGPDGAAYRLVAEACASPGSSRHVAVLVEPARPSDPAGLLRLGLTRREADVTIALLRRDSVADCARTLGCTPATVAQHKKNVFAKLDVSSRRQLAVRLLAHGWRDGP